jgi:hypothetical protein
MQDGRSILQMKEQFQVKRKAIQLIAFGHLMTV